MQYGRVIANGSGLANDHPSCVFDRDPSPDGWRRVDVHAKCRQHQGFEEEGNKPLPPQGCGIVILTTAATPPSAIFASAPAPDVFLTGFQALLATQWMTRL